MRSIGLFLLLALLSGFVQAQEVEDFRLIQAQAYLPTITLWLNLPTATAVKPEQFSVSIGAEAANVTAIDGFRQTNEGVAYTFLVDISKSLTPQQFLQIKQALKHWVNGMGKHDQAALISFGREVKPILAFSADHDRLSNAIDGLNATDMETSLYQGLLEAISLERHQTSDLPARRAIVVLSDGIDDSFSGVSVDEIAAQSREYRVPIYSIGFAAPPINEAKRQGLKVMSMLARQSGGFFVQAESNQLDDAYEQQHQQIMQAYRILINCASCRADGQLHRLNLTWNDGQRILSDGLDMRLLPDRVVNQSKEPQEKPVDMSVQTLIFAIGFFAFLAGMGLVYRQRLAQTQRDMSELNTDTVPTLKPLEPAPKSSGGLTIQLTVVTGMQKGRVYRLPVAERTTLGRASNCDLTLDDDVEISGQHAMLQYLNGKLSIRDLKSTNGILINGVPIYNDYPLRNGDLLLLGRTELRIELPGQP